MPEATERTAEDVISERAQVQLEVFLDQHRRAIRACLAGLTEEQARRRLVASKTTLLGLVKHATFVERVWFEEAITCRPRTELGLPATPDESFDLTEDDTIESIRAAHEQACAASRAATAQLGLDDVVRGNRRGPLPLRWVYFHVLRELAQHCGHADILREQILSGQLSLSCQGDPPATWNARARRERQPASASRGTALNTSPGSRSLRPGGPATG